MDLETSRRKALRGLNVVNSVIGGGDIDSEKLFAYADETTIACDLGDGMRDFSGVGVLVCGAPVEASVIQQSMTALEGDPDREVSERRALDERTLGRQFFHASEDSANAHSHLCRAVREEVAGVFFYCVFDRTRFSLRFRDRPVGWVQNGAFEVTSDLTLGASRPIHFTIEGRDGQGDLGRKWLRGFLDARDRGVYNVPAIPVPYPPIEVKTSGKSCPGLQVTDFLLWSINRRIVDPGDPWAERAGLQTNFHSHEESGRQVFAKYSLGPRFLDLPINQYPNEVLPVPEWTGHDRVRDSFIVMNHVVEETSTQVLDKAPHLESCVRECFPGRGRRHLLDPVQAVRAVARAYLRLFDTLPVYAGLSPEDVDTWHRLLGARRIASLVQRDDLAHGVETLGYLARFRNDLQANHPEVLATAPRWLCSSPMERH
jgi:hypothetical protein